MPLFYDKTKATLQYENIRGEVLLVNLQASCPQHCQIKDSNEDVPGGLFINFPKQLFQIHYEQLFLLLVTCNTSHDIFICFYTIICVLFIRSPMVADNQQQVCLGVSKNSFEAFRIVPDKPL